MTISTSRTRELTIDTIIRRSYQLAGLVPAEQGTLTDAKATLGRDFLEMEIDDLQTAGALVRQIDFEDIDIVANTATYTMPSYVLNVIEDGSLLLDTETTGATPVIPMSRQAYHALSDKVSTGRPYNYYIHRTSAMTLYLWPVPDAAATLTLQVHKLLADNNDGTKTVDLERHWASFLCYATAAKLALAHSLPMSLVGKLESNARKKREEAVAYSTPREPGLFYMAHSTPWSR